MSELLKHKTCLWTIQCVQTAPGDFDVLKLKVLLWQPVIYNVFQHCYPHVISPLWEVCVLRAMSNIIKVLYFSDHCNSFMEESIFIYFTVVKNITYIIQWTPYNHDSHLCNISKLSSFFWSPVINAWWYAAYCAITNASLNLVQSRGNANYPNVCLQPCTRKCLGKLLLV